MAGTKMRTHIAVTIRKANMASYFKTATYYVIRVTSNETSALRKYLWWHRGTDTRLFYLALIELAR